VSTEDLWRQISTMAPEGADGVPREVGVQKRRLTVEELQSMHDAVGKPYTARDVRFVEDADGLPAGTETIEYTAIFASPVLHERDWPEGWSQDQLEETFYELCFMSQAQIDEMKGPKHD